jgi:hypothetical protein
MSMAIPRTMSTVPTTRSQLSPGPVPVKARVPDEAVTTEALAVLPDAAPAVVPPLDVDAEAPGPTAGL